VNFCHHLSSVVRYFSPFNLLLWNPSAKWTETWWEASMETINKKRQKHTYIKIRKINWF
jgi:hypothetical protein